MATKNDITDFLYHLALKWNIRRIDFHPQSKKDRNTFFRREALNLQFTAKNEVRTVVKAMLEFPDKADWIFDQHFIILTQGDTPSPDCNEMSDEVKEKFDTGMIKLSKEFEEVA